MSDNELDAELLALAGDESGSENQHNDAQEVPPTSPKAPAEIHGPAVPKGVAQRIPAKGAKSSMRGGDLKQATDHIRSPSSSSQSMIMSESESDAPPIVTTKAEVRAGATADADADAEEEDVEDDTGELFPLEGRFHNERDRQEIMRLPEIQREQILAERAAEVEEKLRKQQLRELYHSRDAASKATAQKKRKANASDLDDSPRKSSRAKVKTSENLENYKRQREQRNEQRRRGDDRKNRGRLSPDRDEDDDADGELDDEVEWADKPSRDQEARQEQPPELREFQRIHVGRSNFARVCFTPGFDDAIKGCYCRVCVGPDRETGHNVYRMVQIKGFTNGRPYMMEGSNKRPIYTDQYALLTQGKDPRDFPFVACSDGKFTEREFERYKAQMQTDGLRLPTSSFLSTKYAAIQHLANHSWTDREITEKLQRMTLIKDRFEGKNRASLLEQRERAIADGDEATIAKIDKELSAIEKNKLVLASNSSNGTPQPKAPSQQDRLAELNRLHRKANLDTIRKAELEQRRKDELRRAAVARGEAAPDPFARVRTKARLYHDANDSSSSLKVPGSKNIDDLFEGGSDTSRAGTPGPSAPLKNGTNTNGTSKPAGARMKKATDDEVIGALDLGIEIDI